MSQPLNNLGLQTEANQFLATLKRLAAERNKLTEITAAIARYEEAIGESKIRLGEQVREHNSGRALNILLDGPTILRVEVFGDGSRSLMPGDVKLTHERVSQL